MIHPARRSADGPGGKQTLLLRRSLMPSVQAAPLPLFGSRDPIRPQGISFHRPTDRQKMFVILDRKRIEPPLIKMPPTRGLTVSMPSLVVRPCQPADKLRQLAVFLGPDDEVSVIPQACQSSGSIRVRHFNRIGPVPLLRSEGYQSH
jgi:hypothetical protein